MKGWWPIHSSSWRICFYSGLPCSMSLWGPEIMENISLKLNSRCSGCCPPLTEAAKGRPHVPQLCQHLPSLHTSPTPAYSRCGEPKCPLLHPSLVLLHVNIGSAPKVAKSTRSKPICWPACLCCPQCYWTVLYSHEVQLRTQQAIRNGVRCWIGGVCGECVRNVQTQWRPTAGN